MPVDQEHQHDHDEDQLRHQQSQGLSLVIVRLRPYIPTYRRVILNYYIPTILPSKVNGDQLPVSLELIVLFGVHLSLLLPAFPLEVPIKEFIEDEFEPVGLQGVFVDEVGESLRGLFVRTVHRVHCDPHEILHHARDQSLQHRGGQLQAGVRVDLQQKGLETPIDEEIQSEQLEPVLLARRVDFEVGRLHCLPCDPLHFLHQITHLVFLLWKLGVKVPLELTVGHFVPRLIFPIALRIYLNRVIGEVCEHIAQVIQTVWFGTGSEVTLGVPIELMNSTDTNGEQVGTDIELPPMEQHEVGYVLLDDEGVLLPFGQIHLYFREGLRNKYPVTSVTVLARLHNPNRMLEALCLFLEFPEGTRLHILNEEGQWYDFEDVLGFVLEIGRQVLEQGVLVSDHVVGVEVIMNHFRSGETPQPSDLLVFRQSLIEPTAEFSVEKSEMFSAVCIGEVTADEISEQPDLGVLGIFVSPSESVGVFELGPYEVGSSNVVGLLPPPPFLHDGDHKVLVVAPSHEVVQFGGIRRAQVAPVRVEDYLHRVQHPLQLRFMGPALLSRRPFVVFGEVRMVFQEVRLFLSVYSPSQFHFALEVALGAEVVIKRRSLYLLQLIALLGLLDAETKAGSLRTIPLLLVLLLYFLIVLFLGSGEDLLIVKGLIVKSIQLVNQSVLLLGVEHFELHTHFVRLVRNGFVAVLDLLHSLPLLVAYPEMQSLQTFALAQVVSSSLPLFTDFKGNGGLDALRHELLWDNYIAISRGHSNLFSVYHCLSLLHTPLQDRLILTSTRKQAVIIKTEQHVSNVATVPPSTHAFAVFEDTGILQQPDLASIITTCEQSHSVLRSQMGPVDGVDIRPVHAWLPNTLNWPPQSYIPSVPLFVASHGGPACHLLAGVGFPKEEFVGSTGRVQVIPIAGEIEMLDVAVVLYRLGLELYRVVVLIPLENVYPAVMRSDSQETPIRGELDVTNLLLADWLAVFGLHLIVQDPHSAIQTPHHDIATVRHRQASSLHGIGELLRLNFHRFQLHVKFQIDTGDLLHLLNVPHPESAVVRTAHIGLLIQTQSPNLVCDTVWGVVSVHVVPHQLELSSALHIHYL